VDCDNIKGKEVLRAPSGVVASLGGFKAGDFPIDQNLSDIEALIRDGGRTSYKLAAASKEKQGCFAGDTLLKGAVKGFIPCVTHAFETIGYVRPASTAASFTTPTRRGNTPNQDQQHKARDKLVDRQDLMRKDRRISVQGQDTEAEAEDAVGTVATGAIGASTVASSPHDLVSVAAPTLVSTLVPDTIDALRLGFLADPATGEVSI
jgi:hypothetical protein